MPPVIPDAAAPLGRKRPADDLITLVLIGGASYVAAAVAHETIGHGLATVLTGGKVLLFSSVHILTDRSTRIIDIAGPTNNLIAGGLFWLALRQWRGASMPTRLFLWLAMARNLFWGTGYMLYSGVLGQGDWLSLIRGLHPSWFWVLALEVVGALGYGLSALLVIRWSRTFAVETKRLREIILITYFAGGGVACAAAALDPAGAGWAITDNAAPASFLAGVGFLVVPWLRKKLFPSFRETNTDAISASTAWIMIGVSMIVLFVAVLGPGVRP